MPQRNKKESESDQPRSILASKRITGGSVVMWVTSGEHLLLYVFDFFSFLGQSISLGFLNVEKRLGWFQVVGYSVPASGGLANVLLDTIVAVGIS